jgi:deoxyribodipyrimidine photo-lyase
MKKWRTQLNDFYLKSYPTLSYQQYLHKNWLIKPHAVPSLLDLGFHKTNTIFPDKAPAITTIKTYDETRDYPYLNSGTSKLGLHLRFGTISIRKLATFALKTNQTFLNELIWREFFSQILFHFPQVQTKAFKAQYDKIQWQNDPNHIKAWQNGQTGYPIIDAGMRELNATGHMHNRVRMIVASFLVKDLLCDWRIGEAYFAEKLLDYDLASNNGNWQWAAGTGCDAAPYFRIFNPELQTKRFDPELKYIKKWVPELESPNYPSPIVDHKLAKNRCLVAYKEALAT